MKRITTSWGLLLLLSLLACDDDEQMESDEQLPRISFLSQTAELLTHSLAYATNTADGAIVFFENGLGDSYIVWDEVSQIVGQDHQVVLYNRGGYGTSEPGPDPRDFQQLIKELLALKNLVTPDQKIYLVGHSIGGALIRAFSITYPDQVAGLVFVDSSHENDLVLTQDEEDQIVANYEGNLGASNESEWLIENMELLKTLGPLPDVPTIALTGNRGKSTSAAEAWTAMHRSLGAGLSDFQQLSSNQSGHYIQRDEPAWVAEMILELLPE